jgi:hypothetical protein
MARLKVDLTPAAVQIAERWRKHGAKLRQIASAG